MTAPLFITTEKHSGVLPLLIIDKPGVFSTGLVSLLSEHFTTMLVSERFRLPHLRHVRHIPFKRSVPAIPDEYFSAIIVFYHGERALSDSMQAFLKKAKQNNAKLLFITSRELSTAPFLSKAVEEYEGAHLLLYGDVFGVSTPEDSPISHLVYEAAHHQRLSIHGSGLTEFVPVYYPDVLQGILHVLLSHRPPKVGLLFPRHSVPEIHIARLLEKLYPQATIQFLAHTEDDTKKTAHPKGIYLLEDPYPLDEKLKHLKPSQQQLLAKSSAKFRRKRRWFRKKQHVPYLLGGIAVCALLFFSSFFLFAFGALSLKVAVNAAKKGEISLALRRADTARMFLGLSARSAEGITVLLRPLGFGDVAASYADTADAAATAADVAYHLAEAGLTYGPIAKGESQQSSEELVRISTDLKQAVLGLQKLRAEGKVPTAYQKELDRLKTPLRQYSGLIELLPFLAGVGREQVYLVVFQNNMELRPGGGFIGSYGLLTLQNGRIASFTIHDVYDADGQLKGHVDPPHGLKRYLGASHWFMRDSNFSIEFSQNAAQAASFLQLSTGESVDGVIAVDVSFLRTVLEKTGPVYVPAYDETVNAKNFYLTAQTHAEKDFFPGSTQKKDFLQHVAKALLTSVTEGDNVPLSALLAAGQQAILQKHLMFASADARIMTLLVKNGAAPSVAMSPAEHKADITDSIGWFEANVGANKANYYVKRRFDHSVFLHAGGERQGSFTATYINSASANDPFSGDYHNYIQAVLPENAVVTGILLDDTEQALVLPVTSERVYRAESFVPPSGIELSQERLHGRLVAGFYVMIPRGKTRTVTLRYTLVPQQNVPEQFSSLLRIIKQPGTDFDPYRLVYTFDPSLTLMKKPDFVSQAGNTLTVSRELVEDIFIPLDFTKP